MTLLLDTCAALWWWAGDSRLSRLAAEALGDSANKIVFHQISYLEMTIKHSLGKLPLGESPELLVPKALAAYQVGYRVLSNADIARSALLPWHHRDPFDRLLIAHAIDQSLTVVTSDGKFTEYGVPVLW